MKLHKRTKIYKGKTISLREDLLERPDGSFTRWSVVEHPGAVAMIPLDGSGNVILVDQFRYAAEESLLELPLVHARKMRLLLKLHVESLEKR